MERVIDRSEYRRNNEKEKIVTEEQVEILKSKIKTIIYQSLYASILLLIVSVLKYNKCTKILEKISDKLNDEITFDLVQKDGQRIFDKATNYYMRFNSFIEQAIQDGNNLNLFMDNKMSMDIVIMELEDLLEISKFIIQNKKTKKDIKKLKKIIEELKSEYM